MASNWAARVTGVVVALVAAGRIGRAGLLAIPARSGGSPAPTVERRAGSTRKTASVGSHGVVIAADNARRAAAVGQAVMPPRVIRLHAVSSRRPVIRDRCSHGPQASDSAGSPWLWR